MSTAERERGRNSEDSILHQTFVACLKIMEWSSDLAVVKKLTTEAEVIAVRQCDHI